MKVRGVGVRFSSAFSSGFLHAELQWIFAQKCNVLYIKNLLNSLLHKAGDLCNTWPFALLEKKQGEAHPLFVYWKKDFLLYTQAEENEIKDDLSWVGFIVYRRIKEIWSGQC